MNDEIRLERLFADGLHELAPRRAPDRLRTTIKAETGETRPRARWLALIKEPTMRTNNRVAVGSPTARVAAIMAATLLALMMIIGAGVAGAQLMAADGQIIVDASGGGDFETIQAAVDAAVAGDTIAIQPGTYTEAVVIDKDLTIVGDGPREEIVLTAPEDGPTQDVDFPWLSSASYAMLLVETDATVRDLTLAGQPSRLFVEGGAPTVSGVLFDKVGQAYDGSAVAGAVVVQSLGTPTFTENELIGGGGLDAYADADPVFERNTLRESGGISGDFGVAAVIRENIITGDGRQGITFLGATAARVVGNAIEGKEWGITTGDGINVTTSADGSSFEPTIEGNSISDTKLFAINLSGGSPILLDNTLAGGRIGINLARSSATVSGTDVGGFAAGVVINRGDATLTDNTITDNGRGLSLVGASTQPTLSGNTICDNETNVHVADDRDLDTEGNEICEDVAPAE